MYTYYPEIGKSYYFNLNILARNVEMVNEDNIILV